MRRSLAALGMRIASLACLTTACDYWSLQVNGDGLLLVTVISDDRISDGGYRVRTRRQDGTTRMFPVPASGRLSLRGPTMGPLELTLLTPEACRVSTPNPQTVEISADEQATAAFEVRCNS